MTVSAKLKLMTSIEDLLRVKKLDEISVSEIIFKAQVCRKTFYRNFKDKYDLVSSYFEGFFSETFGQITTGENFYTSLYHYLEICESKKAIFKNAYACNDVNGLRNYDIEITKRTYEKYLLAKGANITSAEMKFAIEIASRGGTDMVIEWLMNGMKEEKGQLITLIIRTLPNDLLNYLK